ncbi:hypothetical protein [Endozoicomonas sp.]|uniref:hypothetical protein n=1 Tax=Endozoicomonas sp. TaxID=1892382 RepID=UPI00383B02AF
MATAPVSNVFVNPFVIDGASAADQSFNGGKVITGEKDIHQVTKDTADSGFKCVAWKNWVISKLGRTLGYLAMLPSLPILVGLVAYDGFSRIGSSISLIYRKITKPESPVQKHLPVTEKQAPDSSKDLADLYIAKGRSDQEHEDEKVKLEGLLHHQTGQTQRLRDDLQQSGINNDRMVRQYQGEKIELEAQLRDRASQVQQLNADLEHSKDDLQQALVENANGRDVLAREGWEFQQKESGFRLKISEFEQLLQKKEQEYHNSVVDLRSRISEKERVAKEHQLEVFQYKDQLQTVTMNAEAKEGEMEALVVNHQFQLQQQADTKLAFESLAQQLNSERLNFTVQKEQLQFKLNQLNNKCHELERKARKSTETENKHQKELGSSASELKKLKESLVKQIVECNRLEWTLKATEETVRARSSAKIELGKNLNEAQSTVNKYYKELQGLRNTHMEELSDLRKKLAETKDRNRVLEQLSKEETVQINQKRIDLESAEKRMLMMAEKIKQIQFLLNKDLAEQKESQKSCGKPLGDFSFEQEEIWYQAENQAEVIRECCDCLDFLASERELLEEEVAQIRIEKDALQVVLDIHEETIKELRLGGADVLQQVDHNKAEISTVPPALPATEVDIGSNNNSLNLL